MSPTSVPAFETLPAEIHRQILRQMSSPEDLYSTIRGSPKALGSFLCFREDILIQVLQAYLPSEVFAEYLGILHVPKYENFNHVPNESELLDNIWERCRYKAWSTPVNSFLLAHFEKVNAARLSGLETYSKPKTFEKFEVNYIMSMYGMLKRFIRQYQLFVRTTMANTSPHLDFDPPLRDTQLSQEWSPLSQREIARLHRGFLRYEICCRINTIPDHNGAKMQFEGSGIDLLNPLADYLDSWEEEEVQCVGAYVEAQYLGVARNVVEDFCCDVWRHSRRAQHESDNRVTIAPEITPGDNKDTFRGWIYNMRCLGLPLLQQVLRSGVDDQRRFFKNTNLRRLPPYYEFSFLTGQDSMDFHWHDRANNIFNSITLELRRPDDGNAYRRRSGWLYDRPTDDIQTGLRQAGFVFWEDRSRMDYFAYPKRRDSDDHHISHYITTVRRRTIQAWNGLRKVGMGTRYPEETLYVTKADYRNLMDRFAAKPVEPDAEYFLLDRLREISDWLSKGVSPAFQEICSRSLAKD